MKKIISTFVMCLVLAGCGSFKVATIEQRLEGKTGAERQQELFYICLQRFDKPIAGGGHYIGHKSRRGKLCHQMYELDGQPKDQERLVLAKECSKEIEMGLVRDNPQNVKQHKTMQRICEEMTEKPVSVEY